jgi:hypothetical protein
MSPHARLSDAALAVGVVVYETAKLPLGLVERLPGVRRLAAEGALVRLRLRSALGGRLDDVLCAPEVERAIDRAVQRAAPEAVVEPTGDEPGRITSLG